MSQTAQAGWLPIKCINWCTPDSCKNDQRKAACEANCQNSPSVLQDCMQGSQAATTTNPAMSKPLQQPPSVPARRVPPSTPLPALPQKARPSVEKSVSVHSCSHCSKNDCKTNKGRYEFCRQCFGTDIDVKEDSCIEGAKEAGFINLKSDFKNMTALSEGKGIKAKDVLPRFQHISTMMTDLHNRITHLKKKQKVFLKKEKDLQSSIAMIKQMTGLDNPRINPEQELKNYDAVLMTSISGGFASLSAEVCQALVNDFNRKIDSDFKSVFSRTKRTFSSTTKHKQGEKQQKLKSLVNEMNQGCSSWKLETQLAAQQKKDVYEVLQGLWKKIDTQLQEAQALSASK
jgi:hypothetical protein